VALRELEPGLWRWTAGHPAWEPGAEPGSAGDWPSQVGSVLVDAADATVFIDPLVGEEDEELWAELDSHVAERDAPVSVLTTIHFHRRSRVAIAARYDGRLTDSGGPLPVGIEPFEVRGAAETMFWLPRHRALVPGDRLLGSDDGRLRICPQSWLDYLREEMTRARLAELLRPLLEWPIEKVLVSHGEPVLAGGREAVAAALDEAA
jgi:glyoxylase-like metal-dependent hydrolase (beta-lactamase superfamily II)